MTSNPHIPAERVARAILVIRGQRIILDDDLASLYGVETKHLVQAIKRNAGRFPEDFAFQLSAEEWAPLRSQIVTSKGRGGRRYPPHAFTEHGALMAASVLNSPTAVQVALQVVRAFIRIRQLLATNEDLARKVAALDRRTTVNETDLRNLSGAFQKVLEAAPSAPGRRRIGFKVDEERPNDLVEFEMRQRTRAKRPGR